MGLLYVNLNHLWLWIYCEKEIVGLRIITNKQKN